MSCKHGNWEPCDECAQEESAYISAYEAGKKDGWEACESCHGIVDGVHTISKKLRTDLATAQAYDELTAELEHFRKNAKPSFDRQMRDQNTIAELTAEVESYKTAWEQSESACRDLTGKVIHNLRNENSKLTAEVERLKENYDLAIGITNTTLSVSDELRQQNADLTAQRDAAMQDAAHSAFISGILYASKKYESVRTERFSGGDVADFLFMEANELDGEAIDAAIANCKEQK